MSNSTAGEHVAEIEPMPTLAEENEALRAEWEELRPAIGRLALGVRVYEYVMLALCAVFVFVSVPRQLRIKAIGFQMSRMLSRLQVLASKPELAVLTQLEGNVKDEPSLKALIEHCCLIAKRHQAVDIIRPFDVWGFTVPGSTGPEPVDAGGANA